MIDKLKTLVLSVFILLSSLCYSQLDEGNYTYLAEGISIEITISDDVESAESFTITFKDATKSYCIGEWQSVPNTADEDYDGPDGWYVLDCLGCGFEIYLLNDSKIKLSRSTCLEGKNNLTTEEKILHLK